MTGDKVKTGVTVRPLGGDDLDRVIAIDRKLSGRARRGFFESRLAAARRDPGGFIYVGVSDGDDLLGFAMTRLQEGDFGMKISVAVLDAIGVDPGYAHHHVGHALVSQLLANLGALRADRVRTVVNWDHLELLAFLDGCDFEPAQRLSFTRRVV